MHRIVGYIWLLWDEEIDKLIDILEKEKEKRRNKLTLKKEKEQVS